MSKSPDPFPSDVEDMGRLFKCLEHYVKQLANRIRTLEKTVERLERSNRELQKRSHTHDPNPDPDPEWWL